MLLHEVLRRIRGNLRMVGILACERISLLQAEVSDESGLNRDMVANFRDAGL